MHEPSVLRRIETTEFRTPTGKPAEDPNLSPAGVSCPASVFC